MLNATESRFFMIVDDDDFVSSRIVQHVSDNRDANGWTIDRGYIWDDGGSFLFGHDDFSHLCGTSLIIRADLYELPTRFEDASLDWIKSMLGSHVRIADILAQRGAPLTKLPFAGRFIGSPTADRIVRRRACCDSISSTAACSPNPGDGYVIFVS